MFNLVSTWLDGHNGLSDPEVFTEPSKDAVITVCKLWIDDHCFCTDSMGKKHRVAQEKKLAKWDGVSRLKLEDEDGPDLIVTKAGDR